MLNQAWHKNICWLGAIAYMGLIFWLSSKPALPLPIWFQHQDKLYHFVVYHFLAFLLAHAAPGSSQKKRFWFAFALAAIYGASDEFHRSFVPGRDWGVWAWLADTVGGWAGAYLSLKSEGLFRKGSRKPQNLKL